MQDGPRRRTKEAARELRPLDVGHCYHCEDKSVANTHCEVWDVWACKSCLKQHHVTHHVTCKVDIPKNALRDDDKPKSFSLNLTRYGGQMFSMTCTPGQKLEMEDHWLGTYVFFPGGMLLVRETREVINARILAGLQEMQ